MLQTTRPLRVFQTAPVGQHSLRQATIWSCCSFSNSVRTEAMTPSNVRDSKTKPAGRCYLCYLQKCTRRQDPHQLFTWYIQTIGWQLDAIGCYYTVSNPHSAVSKANYSQNWQHRFHDLIRFDPYNLTPESNVWTKYNSSNHNSHRKGI